MAVLFSLFQKNRWFFLPYTLALMVVGVMQLITTQTQLMRWVNIRNTPQTDVFFTYATFLGDGIFFVVICLIILVYNRRAGLLALASFAVSSLVSVLLKTVVFAGSPRPVLFFAPTLSEYHIIKGLNIATINSFPSGHTTSAFALFSLLALLDARKERGWAFFLLAALTGYSRVYLFQHFVEDVFVGSLIGTVVSVGLYLAFRR